MKDWDHIEWKENQKAQKVNGTSKRTGTSTPLKVGDGDGERAAKRELEEEAKKRDSDSLWYGTTT